MMNEQMPVDSTGAQGVFRVDADGRVVYADEQAAAILGYAPDELVGRNFIEFHFEADLPLAQSNFAQRRLGIGAVTEYSLRHKDGSAVLVAVASAPTLDKGGKFLGITGFITDIGARRSQETLFNHEVRLLRMIAGNYPLHSVLEDLCLTLEAVARQPLRAAVMLVKGGGLRCVAAPSLPAEFQCDSAVTALDQGATPCAETVRSGRAVIVEDAAAGPPLATATCRKYAIAAVWSYPIEHDGDTLGTLALLLSAPGAPAAEDMRAVEFAVQLTRLALAREREVRQRQESEQRLRDFAELSADWFWEQDADYRFSHMTGGIYNRGNFRIADSLGKTRWELPIEGVEAAQWEAHRALLVRREVFRDFTYRIHTADGSLRWYAISGAPVFGADGKFLGYRGIGSDITERKLVEEAVRISESLLSEVLELLPVGVWILDAKGRIVRSNPAGRRIWAGERYVGIEQYGEYKGWWLHSGKRIEAGEWAAARAIRKGEISIDEEIEIECFDGTHKIMLNSAMPIRGEGGAIRGGIIVNQDITARWRAERQVRELAASLEARVKARTAELEEAMRELDAFNFSVSHDLRTPLRAIEGFSRALSEDYDAQLDETGRDYLRRIAVATTRMGELIGALYELSRLSRASLRLHRVDLSALAGELVAELRLQEPQRAVAIEIEATPPVEGDTQLLRIALGNLLGNAWKFTARTASARIAFGARTDADGGVEYFVRDNGAGFDMQFADKLFRLFHRLHREDEFPGQGIGLSTVQRIVARHGGHIRGEAEPGNGASFRFKLWTDPAQLAEARAGDEEG